MPLSSLMRTPLAPCAGAWGRRRRPTVARATRRAMEDGTGSAAARGGSPLASGPGRPPGRPGLSLDARRRRRREAHAVVPRSGERCRPLRRPRASTPRRRTRPPDGSRNRLDSGRVCACATTVVRADTYKLSRALDLPRGVTPTGRHHRERGRGARSGARRTASTGHHGADVHVSSPRARAISAELSGAPVRHYETRARPDRGGGGGSASDPTWRRVARADRRRRARQAPTKASTSDPNQYRSCRCRQMVRVRSCLIVT